MEVKDIKELILTINNTDIETVEIHKGDFKIFISKGIISWRKTNPKQGKSLANLISSLI